MIFKASKTYQTITPDSAIAGEYEETGYEYEDKTFTLRELIDKIICNGFAELSCSNIDFLKHNKTITRVWISTIESVHDRNYFEKGIETYYSLHIDCTGRQFYKICKLAKIL